MRTRAKEKKVKAVPVGIGILVFVLAFVGGVVSKFVIAPSWAKEYSVQWSGELGTLKTDLPYGVGEANKFDLYLPRDNAKDRYGLVVYLHAGGFTSGDKSGDTQMLSWLCSKGYVACGINYTLRTDANDASAFTQSNEIKAAIPKVIEAAEAEGYSIDRLAMAGGSAGHTLAMLYAYRDAAESPVPVVLTFGAVGPSCFHTEDWSNYGLDRNTQESNQGAAALFGVMLGEEITVEEINAAIRKATIDCTMNPVLCGTSYRNKGVQPLLDAVVEYLPSPLDVPPITGMAPDGETEVVRHSSDEEPFAALAFKIMADPFVGKLAFFRVYSGTLSAGSYTYNSTKRKRERMGRILLMHANHREETDCVYAGDIAAVVGLKETTTGDTLCDERNPVVLESMEFPEPVIRVAIEPKTKAGQDKMTMALVRLAEEDPTFKTYTDKDTGQTLIAGMGELHLEIIVDRLLREFKVEATVGKPQVAYKETIRKTSKAEGRYVRQTGGHGMYGHCVIEIEPREPGEGYEFVNATVGGIIPREYIPAIDAGIREAAQSGALGGYEVVDFRATLLDGSYHEVDSSEIAFKIAGSMAFKDANEKADPVLLEPVMNVEIVIPEEYVGDVMGDISSKRGQIGQLDMRAGSQVIDAVIPLSEMFGYATDLRSRTQGRGVFTMQFSHYAEVPKNIAQKVVGVYQSRT